MVIPTHPKTAPIIILIPFFKKFWHTVPNTMDVIASKIGITVIAAGVKPKVKMFGS
jgi:hypothetical protein